MGVWGRLEGSWGAEVGFRVQNLEFRNLVQDLLKIPYTGFGVCSGMGSSIN